MPELDNSVVEPAGVSCPTRCGTGVGMVRAFSMDLINDPRFISNNVVEKRLAAFGALSVVSSLMVKTSVKELFKLKKEMDLSTFHGSSQLVGFVLMSMVLFLCLQATVTIIHQLLFMHRLLTSGPTGFELAASFYLHKSITSWRHFAVKALGVAIPIFLCSLGFMFFVLFENGSEKEPKLKKKHLNANVHHWLAVIVLIVYLFFALIMYYIRHVHLVVFQEHYEQGRVEPMSVNLVQGMGHHPRGVPLDT